MKRRLLSMLLALCMGLSLGISALAAEKEEAPAGDGVYTAPEELGTDPLTMIFELDGVLYQLPVPFSAFEADGWAFAREEDASDMIEPDGLMGSGIYTIIKNGDYKRSITVKLHNYGDAPAEAQDCYVINIEASIDKDVSMVLPEAEANIELGMDGDAFLAVIRPSEVLYYHGDGRPDEVNYRAYIDPDGGSDPFISSNIKCVYNEKDDVICRIELEYEPDVLPY